MAKAHPQGIGGLSFKTKEELRNHVRRILNESALDTPLSEPYRGFLLALLGRHPQAADKIGAGVRDVLVRQAPGWTTRCFFVRRVDDTEAEFSYVECLSPTSPLKRFKEASRAAVEPQVLTFRNAKFDSGQELRCAITGHIVGRDDCHIDHHEPSFDRLVEDFLSAGKIDVEKVEYHGWADGETRMRFKDVALEQAWAAYHQEHANLRMTSKKANLTKPRNAQ